LAALKPSIGLKISAVASGLLVTHVDHGNSAHNAGICARDIIISVNSQLMSTREDFFRIYLQAHPGDKLRFRISRDSVEKYLDVVLLSKGYTLEDILKLCALANP